MCTDGLFPRIGDDRSEGCEQTGGAARDFPAALGWVGVVSWLTEDVALMQLPVAVEPVAYLDNSPFLLPAARLLDDF